MLTCEMDRWFSKFLRHLTKGFCMARLWMLGKRQSLMLAPPASIKVTAADFFFFHQVMRKLHRPILSLSLRRIIRIQFAFRSIKLPGMTDEQANAYAKTLKMYPLSEAADPQATRFVDGYSDRISTLPFYDFRYFQELYEIVSIEPEEVLWDKNFKLPYPELVKRSALSMITKRLSIR